jgi:hypothetical protein
MFNDSSILIFDKVQQKNDLFINTSLQRHRHFIFWAVIGSTNNKSAEVKMKKKLMPFSY